MGILIAILLACLAYWIVITVTGVFILAILAAAVVLLGGFSYGPGPWGGGWGGRGPPA